VPGSGKSEGILLDIFKDLLAISIVGLKLIFAFIEPGNRPVNLRTKTHQIVKLCGQLQI